MMRALMTPRALVLFAAGLVFAVAVFLWFSGYQFEAIFVGMWVPSILILGIWIDQSDRHNRSGRRRS